MSPSKKGSWQPRAGNATLTSKPDSLDQLGGDLAANNNAVLEVVYPRHKNDERHIGGSINVYSRVYRKV